MLTSFWIVVFFIVINRLTTQTWCIDNGFELVELDPDEDSDSETEGNLSTLLQLTFKKGASSIGQHLKKKILFSEWHNVCILSIYLFFWSSFLSAIEVGKRDLYTHSILILKLYFTFLKQNLALYIKVVLIFLHVYEQLLLLCVLMIDKWWLQIIIKLVWNNVTKQTKLESKQIVNTTVFATYTVTCVSF